MLIMKKVLFVSLLILNTVFIQSQKLAVIHHWNKGEIVTESGTKKGLVDLPGSISTKNIAFKSTKSADIEFISSEKVKQIKIYKDDGTYSVIDHIHVNKRYNSTDSNKIMLSNKLKFVLMVADGPVKAYVVPGEIMFASGGYYKAYKDGSVQAIAIGSTNVGGASFCYLLKKKENDYADFIYNTSWPKSKKRKFIQLWLGDSNAVVEKLNDKKFLKKNELDAFVHIYNEDKGGA